ncbi:response regulator [Nocardioides sp. YIM 152315]|uniref:response regulator n=1 Tax=Nocardioides sp. YIM 152315 TaxID=3031760 RepID=UPI0023D99EB7|nr:response regulator [Nocardioides sp. YIM 152315]MDF1603427.1 response regulator [Nocardioides sp. YIM 152315]
MPRVLIVEDDADVRDWIAHCMLSDGHEIRGVPSGATLRRLHQEEPGYRPDLVLMDYALPDTDGVALLAEIVERWPDLPAVFVTVQWTGEIIDRIERTGAERVAKPFDPDDLRAAARRALTKGPSRG